MSNAFVRILGLAVLGWVMAVNSVWAADADVSNVSGLASFVRHRTLTPDLCTTDGCVKPKPYWALDIQADGMRYELAQAFSEGQSEMPALITLDGKEIHAGDRVVLQGHVEVETRGFAILSDVQNVEVFPPGGKSGESGLPFYGWSCRGIAADELPIYVDIQQNSRAGGYGMRVLAATASAEDGPRKLGEFTDVRLMMTDASIYFEGTDPRLRAQLSIDQQSGRLNHLDSVLRLSGRSRASGFEIPFDTSVRVICDRTR